MFTKNDRETIKLFGFMYWLGTLHGTILVFISICLSVVFIIVWAVPFIAVILNVEQGVVFPVSIFFLVAMWIFLAGVVQKPPQ